MPMTQQEREWLVSCGTPEDWIENAPDDWVVHAPWYVYSRWPWMARQVDGVLSIWRPSPGLVFIGPYWQLSRYPNLARRIFLMRVLVRLLIIRPIRRLFVRGGF